MKKTSYIRPLFLNLFIWIVFFATFLFPSKIGIAAGTSFAFDVANPINNAYLNTKTVTFSGTYSLDTTTYPNSSLTVSIIDNTDPSNPTSIPSAGMVISSDNTWSFNYNFSDGPHTVTFTANDGYNSPISRTVSFTVDTQRPVVSNYKLISANHVGNSNLWQGSPIEDMTYVPLDAKIQITVKDTNGITYKKESDGTTFTNPITVISDSQTSIVSVEDHQAPPQPDANGDYVITFTPSTQLEPSTTYYIYVTTNIIDNSGNSVYPKIIKFTTTSQKDQSIDDDPHGDYDVSDPNVGGNRTNLCVNCHSSHVGGTDKLLAGKYIIDPSQNPTQASNITNYCMVCHDGTTAPRMASKVENMDSTTVSKHDQYLDSKHLPNEGSCASCHDPHLVWSQDNPNYLKNHFVYDHTKVDPSLDAPQQVIDSDNILCEACHGLDTYTLKGYTGVEYNISHYRKSTNRLGTSAPNNNILQDDDLCFRCHNGKKLPNSNIQTLSQDVNSKHNFAALDGSNVTGPLPCAECHETHGSSNIKLLKQKLGQENQHGNFVATTGDWDASKERQFCMACHNGETAVYGVTGKLPDPAVSPAHDPNNADAAEACSHCHGGASQSFLEAAHSPKSAAP